jgi:hypothetical protein
MSNQGNQMKIFNKSSNQMKVKTKTFQNLWDTVKVVLRGKFDVISYSEDYRALLKTIMIYLIFLDKQGQANSIISRRKKNKSQSIN